MAEKLCYICDTITDNRENPSIVIGYNDLVVAAWDPRPAPDWAPRPPDMQHVMLAPWAHKESWFELTLPEYEASRQLGILVATKVFLENGIEDFNFLIEEGEAAGPHVYQQMLLRVPGDVPDPRGGIRYAVDPNTANYLASPPS